VRVITLDNGSAPVGLFEGVGMRNVAERPDLTANMRDASVESLVRDGKVTKAAAGKLDDGPRRSYELVSTGAVGIYMSHLQMCDKERTTLVLEQDAQPKQSLQTQLPAALQLTHEQAADIIIFGPVQIFEGLSPWVPPQQAPSNSPGFEPLGSRGFFGMQGVLYTARGCQRMNELLGPPIEMQIDGALSNHVQWHSKLDEPENTTINIWVEVGAESIVQEHSVSELFQPHINGVDRCTVYSNLTGCWFWPQYLLLSALLLMVFWCIGWQGWLWGRRTMKPEAEKEEPCCWVWLCVCPPYWCAEDKEGKGRAAKPPDEATKLMSSSGR